jgi:hypothetical protein
MAADWKNGFSFPVVIGYIFSLPHPEKRRRSLGFSHRRLAKYGVNKDKIQNIRAGYGAHPAFC